MLKIFTIKYSEKSESFPDSAMSGFLADKEVLRWEGNFFERKGEFFWTVLVEYRASSVPVQVKQGVEKVEKKEDGYKEILIDADCPLFKMLKEWRGRKVRMREFRRILSAIICSLRGFQLQGQLL